MTFTVLEFAVSPHNAQRRNGNDAFQESGQRRTFTRLLVEGKISDETFDEWNGKTRAKRLPERVGLPKVRRRERKAAKKR